MKTFSYKGYTTAGGSAKGLIEALDLKDARERLSRQGILAESVRPAGESARWVWLRKDVVFDLDTRSIFYRELGAMLGAGLTLSNALTILIDAPELGENRGVLAGARDRIREGAALAAALADVSDRVTPFEQAVIQTGEKAGNLDQVLNRLADHMEEQRKVRDRLVSAMIYPSIILTLSLLVGAAMLVFMMPWLRTLLEESGVQMPLLTRVMIGLGQITTWLLPLVVVGGGWAFWSARRRWHCDSAYRVRMDRWLYRLPLVGSFYVTLVNLRYARTLSMLLRSGLPMIDSLGQSARATNSPWIVHLMEAEMERVRHGVSLSDSLSQIEPLSHSLPGWLRAGESSGDMPGMLEAAATRFQQQWERRLTRTLTVMESALMIIVGLFVLMLALSIMLPILSMNEMLR